MTIPFPRENAFVEVLNEGGRGRRANNTAAVAYFLGPNKQSPLSPLPTDVKIQIKDGTDVKDVPLRPAPAAKKGDPLSVSRFASEIGPYVLNDRECVLTGSLDGKSFSFEFSGGRLR